MFLRFLKQANNAVNLVTKRSAGHSKWQNIRHTKAAKDLQRSLLFCKLGQRIKVSIQENGKNSNPETNFQLAQAIENAKKNSMPIATIQNFIKNSPAEKEKTQSSWVTVKGPKGSILLISTLSTNFVKTKYELASILKKHGGIFADASGVFEQKGIIVATPSSDLEDTNEAVVEHAIEAGAEDVKPDENKENSFLFTCGVRELFQAKKNLTELKYTIQESDIVYVAKTYAANLSDEEMERVSKLIEKLEEHPDVACVYDNIM